MIGRMRKIRYLVSLEGERHIMETSIAAHLVKLVPVLVFFLELLNQFLLL